MSQGVSLEVEQGVNLNLKQINNKNYQKKKTYKIIIKLNNKNAINFIIIKLIIFQY